MRGRAPAQSIDAAADRPDGRPRVVRVGPRSPSPRSRAPSSPAGTRPCGDRRPRRIQAAPLQASSSCKTYRWPSGQVGLETPAGLYHDPEQGGQPVPGACPTSAWAGSLAGKVIPGGRPTTRSRPAGWASTTAPASTAPTGGLAGQRGLARLRPDGDPRRDRALRPGPVAAPSTSPEPALRADRLHRDLLPAPRSREACRPVCRMQRVPMKIPAPACAAPRTTSWTRRWGPGWGATARPARRRVHAGFRAAGAWPRARPEC